MPEIELLDGIIIKGINLCKMLAKMNERIEVLYDREHTLGHAFFISLQSASNEDEGFRDLQNIFKNKIIPLLEEYFFEDWEKIQLVLGDNQKQDNTNKFIIEKDYNEIDGLFGSDYEADYNLSDTKSFHKNEGAISQVSSYIKIYES